MPGSNLLCDRTADVSDEPTNLNPCKVGLRGVCPDALCRRVLPGEPPPLSKPIRRQHICAASFRLWPECHKNVILRRRRGLARDPSPWQGHYELARALLGLNRLDEADKSVTESINRKPDYAPAYLMRANIHIRKKDYSALIQDLDEFLRLNPAGSMSADARQTREKIQRMLTQSATSPPLLN